MRQERRDLALTVGQYGRAGSLYNLLSQSRRFALETAAARAVIDEVVTAVRGWREVYRGCGVSATDCERMESAFLPAGFFYGNTPAP